MHRNNTHRTVHWALFGAFVLFINLFLLSAISLPLATSSIIARTPALLVSPSRLAHAPVQNTTNPTQVLGISVSVSDADTSEPAQPKPTPPTVTITNPRDGGVLQSGTTIRIQAETSQYSQIKKVEFYEGSELICSLTVAPYGCNWNTPDRNSTTTITATAYDAEGNTGKDSVRFSTRDLSAASAKAQ